MPHGGCPVLAFFARACPELAEGVGVDAAGATLVRSALPVVDAVVVPALRKVREGRGTRNSCPFYTARCGCRRPARPSQSTRRTGHPRNQSFSFLFRLR